MNVLISYHYEKRSQFYIDLTESGVRVLVDSGAFSADRLGAKIDVDDYATMLKEVHGKVDGYFTLDVMRNPDASRENHLYLKSLGLCPIPIYQSTDMKFEDLEDFLEDESYVAIGGLVSAPNVHKPSKFNEARISEFLRRQRQIAPDVKVHLLGYVKKNQLRHFQPYSCDSIGNRADLYGYNMKIYHGGRWLQMPYPKPGKTKNLQPAEVKTAATIAKLFRVESWADLTPKDWRAINLLGYMMWGRMLAQTGGPLVYSALVPRDFLEIVPMACHIDWIQENAPCLKYLS